MLDSKDTRNDKEGIDHEQKREEVVDSGGKDAGSSHYENEISPIIKDLGTEDIKSIALSENRYKKGQTILHLIKDLTTTLDDKDLQISCTYCLVTVLSLNLVLPTKVHVIHILSQQGAGSQGQTYCVTATIENHGIKKAKCTCQDSAGQTGQCKHVVAMLLKYIDKDNHITKEKLGHPTSDISLEPIKNKGQKRPAKSNKRKDVSSKRTPGWQNTLYVMSSQELLETAYQILHEHQKTNENRSKEEDTTKRYNEIKNSKVAKDISSVTSSQNCHYREVTTASIKQTPEPKPHDSLHEHEQSSSPSESHLVVHVHQAIIKENQSDTDLLHEDSKRQQTSYGKSILDEMI